MPALIFASSRSGLPVGLALVLFYAAALLLVPQSYHQPFSAWMEPQPVAPLAPVVASLALGFALLNRMPMLERPCRRLRMARLAWSGTLTAGSAAAMGVATLLAGDEWHFAMVRNAMALAGLALLGAVLLGARLAWAAVFVPGIATLLAGRDAYTAETRSWSLLTMPGESVLAVLVTSVLVVAGMAAYTLWDSRPTKGVSGE